MFGYTMFMFIFADKQQAGVYIDPRRFLEIDKFLLLGDRQQPLKHENVIPAAGR